jgi:hypothetical protein
MKERLVKGTNLVQVVRLLRAHQRSHALPEMGAWEQDLLRKRVAPSTWYSLGVFDSLLQIAHRFVHDGSEAAAQGMGRRFALELISARQAAGKSLPPQSAVAAVCGLAQRWRDYFNFGELTIVPWPGPDSEHGVRVQATGYPDMSACLGHVIAGWSMQYAESAGAKDVTLRLEERPWMHNSVLAFTLNWQ